jgi:NIPSNAP
MSITCFIRYEIDPTKRAEFEQYARNWGQCIPACGADLVGYFAPHEGSSTTAYGIYHVDNLAHYESYRAELSEHPKGKENYAFAQKEKFLLREDRLFLKLASTPHVPMVKT